MGIFPAALDVQAGIYGGSFDDVPGFGSSFGTLHPEAPAANGGPRISLGETSAKLGILSSFRIHIE